MRGVEGSDARGGRQRCEGWKAAMRGVEGSDARGGRQRCEGWKAAMRGVEGSDASGGRRAGYYVRTRASCASYRSLPPMLVKRWSGVSSA
jgi:hypothetical protein